LVSLLGLLDLLSLATLTCAGRKMLHAPASVVLALIVGLMAAALVSKTVNACPIRNNAPWPALNFMALHIPTPAPHLWKVALLAIALFYLGPLIGSLEVELGTAFSSKAPSHRGFSVAYETLGHARK